MDSASPDKGEAFASRRRVIKGLTSAVPAILTVSSGAALAATSNPLQCIDKTTTVPPVNDCLGDTGGGTASDGWQRSYEENYLGDGDDYELNTLPDNPEEYTDSCLTYVDSNGDRVLPGEGSAVTESCYNSFT